MRRTSKTEGDDPFETEGSGRSRSRRARPLLVGGLLLIAAASAPCVTGTSGSTSTTSTTSTSTTSTSTTTTSTTTTTLPPCVQSCDGGTLTIAVNRQPDDVWGYVTGTGLRPGADVTLCDNLGCHTNGTVASDGSVIRGPLYCCNVGRTVVYASAVTTTGRTINSNTVSNP